MYKDQLFEITVGTCVLVGRYINHEIHYGMKVSHVLNK